MKAVTVAPVIGAAIGHESLGQVLAMIHNQATIENVIRAAYNTRTYSYGHKLTMGVGRPP